MDVNDVGPINLNAAADDFAIDPTLADPALFLPNSPSPEPPKQEPSTSTSVPEATQHDIDQATANAITASLHPLGSEDNPIRDPPTYTAPFQKPDRPADLPDVMFLQFSKRDNFESWLAGEMSWCHFVQRRNTTPEKRAEERLRARIKAYEKMLEGMSPAEQAAAAPLKKRRRLRTSNVAHKITYTCHHAGKYTATHSTDVPPEKRRMNTKKSVKCNCPAKIVLSEMQEGECAVQYTWKHHGHDPYADDEWDTGKLPKVIDDWLNQQILDGKEPHDIRRMLDMNENEKQEYLKNAANDPNALPPALPAIAQFNVKIKYPDIYNRYRKLRGPLRPSTLTGSSTRGTKRNAKGVPKQAEQDEQDEPEEPVETFNFEAGQNGLDIPELANLGSQHHVDLAQALLKLPGGEIDEEVLRMAQQAAGETGDEHGDADGTWSLNIALGDEQ